MMPWLPKVSPGDISFSAACWRALSRRGASAASSLKAVGYKSPNEKLNIASIGAGGKAASDIRACARNREHRGALRCRRASAPKHLHAITTKLRSTKISA